MNYPSPPWTLQGEAIQAVHLIDFAVARALVPAELEIIPIFPGKTLGGIYLAHYQAGSVLEYHELIVIAAMVGGGGKIGAWISHIYVDNPSSLLGGREIWGLPKELAQFTWYPGDPCPSVTVQKGERSLCSLVCTNSILPAATWGKLPFNGSVFSTLDTNLVFFESEFSARFKVVSGKLDIPKTSPLNDLNLGQPLLTVYCEEMRLVVPAPEIVQQAVEFSYS